jgi:hypothetical protein
LEDSIATKFQQKLSVDKEQERLRRLTEAARYIQKAAVMQEEREDANGIGGGGEPD